MDKMAEFRLIEKVAKKQLSDNVVSGALGGAALGIAPALFNELDIGLSMRNLYKRKIFKTPASRIATIMGVSALIGGVGGAIKDKLLTENKKESTV